MRRGEMEEEKARERWLAGSREVEAEVRWGLVAEERSLEKANEAVAAAIFLKWRWRRRRRRSGVYEVVEMDGGNDDE